LIIFNNDKSKKIIALIKDIEWVVGVLNLIYGLYFRTKDIRLRSFPRLV